MSQESFARHVVDLLPHQARLVEAVDSPASQRIVLLQSDVQMGQGGTLVALAERQLRATPEGRVLLVVPKALIEQVRHRLQEVGLSPWVVDRYAFREMVAAGPDQGLWPAGCLVVVGSVFAATTDLTASLGACPWDLALVQGWRRTKRRGPIPLLHALAQARRVVLCLQPMAPAPPPGSLDGEPFTLVTWKRDELVDPAGQPLFLPVEPILEPVPYTLSAEELAVRETVQALCGHIEGPFAWLLPGLLKQSLQSSPANFEEVLSALAAGDIVPEGEDDFVREARWTPTEEAQFDHLREQHQALGQDSKAVAAGLRLIRLLTAPSPRVLVLTSSRATLSYLEATCEGLDLACRTCHGGLDWQERAEAVRAFQAEGGLLLATEAMVAEGMPLAEVTDLVLYDQPSQPARLQAILGQLYGISRRVQLRVHALEPVAPGDSLSD